MKLDGYRMQAAVSDGCATWFSRNGHDWCDRLPEFAAPLAELPDCVLDGEMCCLRPDGRSDLLALRSAMGRREASALVGDLRFFAFDCLRHGDENLTNQALAVRKEHLEILLPPGYEALSSCGYATAECASALQNTPSLAIVHVQSACTHTLK